MSLQMYNQISAKLSKKLTKNYSTSFSLGISAFSKELREPVYSIYAYVRIADEIVDTFHGYDKRALLEKFRKDTIEAINQGISTNPVLQAFQHVVNRYNIEWELIDAFLKSMEMDLTENSYSRSDYDNYIYGSAEVVGLMCLRVFVNGEEKMYRDLEYFAKMLGSAFQKVNFLRDIKSDLEERGRIYLPNVHSSFMIDDHHKKILEAEVQKEFDQALEGIKKLPAGAKLGVYSAYLYYIFLFRKIKSLGVEKLKKRRVRISNGKKLLLLLKSIIEVKLLKVT